MLRLLTAAFVLVCFTAAVHAETYQERLARWQSEWRTQHPGEPMPNDGALQKLHRQELIQQSNKDWDAGRALRQKELQREFLLSRYNQQQINAKNGVKWNAAQWRVWEQRYSDEHRQMAEDYARSWALMGEMARERAAQEEYERQLRGESR